MATTTIRSRLTKAFSAALLVPSFITAAIGVTVIYRQVYQQAQVHVNANLEAAKELWKSQLERLEDAVRIHATRMIVYRALDPGDRATLQPEMERIRAAEGIDFLTLTDSQGIVLHRSANLGETGDDRSSDPVIRAAIQRRVPIAGVEIMAEGDLALESPALPPQARMALTETPMAAPLRKTTETSGMVLLAAAPVLAPGGKFLGSLYAGVLLNRNYAIVDKVRSTVFKEEVYEGRELGSATVFLDDIRISTNVRNANGSRAIATRVSAEVAEAVLRRGETWRGRAFVVNDWYLAAYEPLRDPDGRTVGMLYVGTLERPYRDLLWRLLITFVGTGLLGVAIVGLVAFRIAGRISQPLHDVAEAAHRVAAGDYTPQVAATSSDEIGQLVDSFNGMVKELDRTHQELRNWTTTLETRVEERTAQLKAMQGRLVQTEKLAAIGKLAAGVAHEINNPLTGVLTNSSLMLEDLPSDDPRRPDLQTIVEETLRCRKIVRGLLEFARQTQPHKQPVDMNRVAEDVLNLVRNQASFRDVTVTTALEPNLPPVMADRDQMRQVLLNAVLNASEAMTAGGKLRVSSRLDRATNDVCIEVRDNGPGIKEEVRSRLFEPFFTTKKSGTGLGLSIAYGIMEQHRGSIAIDCPPSGGTAVSFRIPVEDSNGHE